MAVSPIKADNFLGIALIINRSRDGPAFVFHYPPHIRPLGNEGTTDSAELDDLLLQRLAQPTNTDPSRPGVPKNWNRDDHYMTEAGSQIVPWEHCAGFPARDLASVLTPGRSYHKKLFHLSLDPLHCVSYPIHAPASGRWKKPKKTDNQRPKPSDDSLLSPQDAEHHANGSKASSEGSGEKDSSMKKEEDDEKRASMTMFSLVFFLHPKQDEVQHLVDALYTNIVKKANKAFKYSQQHSDFVWKESKRILAAKDKAREEHLKMSALWKEILQMSSLAGAMHDIYEAVSHNKIAALHLETAAGVLTPSFQIPAPFYVSDLPLPGEEETQRGLWLTTANAFMSPEDLEEPGFLDRNFALLLMDDEKKIIAELQADPDPTTMAMVEFVRLSKPTMSFYQVGQSNSLTLSQVRKYAQHFIFWRRAIAIPPLHARDTYVVSPNCDASRLPRDALDWQRQFPVAPSLPAFLGELSQAPRPWKHFAPSKIHRPTYLLMLAWLMRRGWVTQLCTFAYVIVWPEIIYEVEYEMEKEDLAAEEKAREDKESEAAAAAAAAAATAATEAEASTGSITEVPIAPPSGIPKSSNVATIPKSSSSLSMVEDLESSIASLSTNADSNSQTPTSPSTISHTAEKARLTRLHDKHLREATERKILHSRKTPPTSTLHPSLNAAPHLSHLEPYVILDPKKATGKESRYLSAMTKRLGDEKVRSAFGLFCKYFDGRTALERIALQEDMKRKEVWGLLTGMTECIICTRHW